MNVPQNAELLAVGATIQFGIGFASGLPHKYFQLKVCVYVPTSVSLFGDSTWKLRSVHSANSPFHTMCAHLDTLNVIIWLGCQRPV